jgi:hypothetical protein
MYRSLMCRILQKSRNYSSSHLLGLLSLQNNVSELVQGRFVLSQSDSRLLVNSSHLICDCSFTSAIKIFDWILIRSDSQDLMMITKIVKKQKLPVGPGAKLLIKKQGKNKEVDFSVDYFLLIHFIICMCQTEKQTNRVAYLATVAWALSTLLTIFCSSMRKARTTRWRTQRGQRQPPYERLTVFMRRDMRLHSTGRAGTTPLSLILQSPHLGNDGFFLMYW